MTRAEMIAAIEGEIARLEQVRELLVSSTSDHFPPAAQDEHKRVKKPRMLSEDARQRISDAQKRRWAKDREVSSDAE